MSVVSPSRLAFERGQKMWADRKPRPPRPTDDDDMSQAFWLWCGYMTARGVDWNRRMRLAKQLGGKPETVEPVG